MNTSPRTYIFGIIIFMLFIGVSYDWLSNLAAYDDTFVQNSDFSTLNESLNRRDNLTSEINSLQSSFNPEDADFGVFGVLPGLINTAWTAIKSFFSSFFFMEEVLSASAGILGVPAWIVGLVTLLITVMVVFTIWSAIFQRDI